MVTRTAFIINAPITVPGFAKMLLFLSSVITILVLNLAEFSLLSLISTWWLLKVTTTSICLGIAAILIKKFCSKLSAISTETGLSYKKLFHFNREHRKRPDENFQTMKEATKVRRKQLLERKKLAKETIDADANLKKYATDKRCEIEVKTNEMQCDSKKRLDKERMASVVELHGRRSSLYIDAIMEGDNISEDSQSHLKSLLPHPSVFQSHEAASVAQITSGQVELPESSRVLAGASATKDLEDQKVLVDKCCTEILNETSESIKKNEEEQIAKLRKFNRNDAKAVALVRKVMSSGNSQPEAIARLNKELAPSWSQLVPGEQDN